MSQIEEGNRDCPLDKLRSLADVRLTMHPENRGKTRVLRRHPRGRWWLPVALALCGWWGVPTSQGQDARNDQAGIAVGPSQDETLDERVRALVEQLDDPALVVRTSAEQQLVELGAAALAPLERHAAGQSAEVRQRLARIIDRLRQEAAEAWLEGSVVNLDVRDDFQTAFDSLAAESGNPIAPLPPTDQQPSPGLVSGVFWSAVDQLAQSAGWEIDIMARDGRLHFQPRGTSESALYVLEPSGFAMIDMANRGDAVPPGLAGVRRRFALLWEPRLQPLVVTMPLEGLRIRNGDADAPLFERGARLETPIRAGQTASAFEVPFPPSSQPLSGKLTGYFDVLVVGPSETVAWDGFLNVDPRGADSLRQRGPLSLAIERIRRRGDGLEVALQLRYGNSGADVSLDSHLDWLTLHEARVLDADGNVVATARLTSSRRDPQTAAVVCQFTVAGLALERLRRLEFSTPTTLVRRQIPFTIPIDDAR